MSILSVITDEVVNIIILWIALLWWTMIHLFKWFVWAWHMEY